MAAQPKGYSQCPPPPAFVQFPHPGGEHGPERGHRTTLKKWNQGPHRRKFILTEGDYVNGRNRLVENKTLLIWGEWEPPSHVTALASRPTPYHPRWLHTPFLPKVLPRAVIASSCKPSETSGQSNCVALCSEKGFQNTDPYVFDGEFKYLICRQGTNRGTRATKLAKLERGSVILFGSCAGVGPQAFFQVDTVFVVAEYEIYDPANEAKSLKVPSVISAHYRDVVVQHAFRIGHPSVEYRLYKGATFHNPVEGMYSFSPARCCNGVPVGFPRLRIRNQNLRKRLASDTNRELLTNNLRQAARISLLPNLRSAAEIWKSVRAISRKAGLVEAVCMATPPIL